MRMILARLGYYCIVLALSFQGAKALDYPWVFLTAEHDSRDSEIVAWDAYESKRMTAGMSTHEEIFHDKLTWKRSTILNLLSLNAPFCELGFDAVQPYEFTAKEKDILREYLKRGGFILFFIDAYPYPEEDFWKVSQWPLIDFFTKELPALDPAFTIGKAKDDSLIFKAPYPTSSYGSILHELNGNPNTPNRTIIFYHDRLCGFVMGRYGYFRDGRWEAISRPFPKNLRPEKRGYELIVNIYANSIIR